MKNLGIRRCDRVRFGDLQNPRKEKVCERKSARRGREERARNVGKWEGDGDGKKETRGVSERARDRGGIGASE